MKKKKIVYMGVFWIRTWFSSAQLLRIGYEGKETCIYGCF